MEDSKILMTVNGLANATSFIIHNSQKSFSRYESNVLEDSAVNLASSCGLWIGVSLEETSINEIKENEIKIENNLNSRNKLVSVSCQGKDDKSEAVSLLIGAQLNKNIGVFSLHVGVDAVQILSYFNYLTVGLVSGKEKPLKVVKIGIDSVSRALEHLCKFLSSAYSDLLGKDTESSNQYFEDFGCDDAAAKIMVKCRQSIMIEQGLLNVLVDLLEMTTTDIFARIKGIRDSHLNSKSERKHENDVVKETKRYISALPTSSKGETDLEESMIFNKPSLVKASSRDSRFYSLNFSSLFRRR
jgi:hypothetical protein